jgi:hypothetical protein
MSDQRTHTGGLFCQEGSTHVNRPSVRVRHPPGGSSGYNFFTGEELKPESKNEVSPHASIPFIDSNSSSANMSNPMDSAAKENDATSLECHEIKSAEESRNQGAIFCSEGGQIVSKPSVRVRNPPGGVTGWKLS